MDHYRARQDFTRSKWVFRLAHVGVLPGLCKTARPLSMSTNFQKVAVVYDQHHMARFLLQQGADMHVEDQDGNSAISGMFRRFNKWQWLETLAVTMDDVQDTMEFSDLHEAVISQRLSREVCERAYLDVNSRDKTGMTPLHWTSLAGDIAAMELLLE